MDKYQRCWKPHPGPPLRPEDDPAGLTPGVVARLRAVTSARRRIWDAEARKWDMRFPMPERRSKLANMLEPVGGVKTRLAGVQQEYAAFRIAEYGDDQQQRLRPQPQQQQQQSALGQENPHESGLGEISFAAHPQNHANDLYSDPFASQDHLNPRLHDSYSAYETAAQDALLLPRPSTDDLDVPTTLITATVTLQRHFRGALTRKRVKAALTYEQLMRRSRLHRLAANRAASDARKESQRQLGRTLARLQAMFRGYRGRRRAAYVRHRVWSAAARVVQFGAAMPFLARKELRQRRTATMFVSMSQRMRNILRIQQWYRAQRARRFAMFEVRSRRYAVTRAEVIDRMSATWGAHICDTAVWKTMAELRRQEEALQWAKRYATMVQSVIRAWGAKKAVMLLRTQKARRAKRRFEAARRIQALVRGYQQRGEVIRRAIFVVQEAARLRWIQRSSTLPGGGVDVLRPAGNGLVKRPATMLQYRIEAASRPGGEIGTIPAALAVAGGEGEEPPAQKWRELTGYDGPEFGVDELLDSDDDDDADSLDDGDSPRYW